MIYLTKQQEEIVKLLQPFCIKDETRPAMTGVYLSNDKAVATNAHYLIAIDTKTDDLDNIFKYTREGFPRKLDTFTEVKEKFPNWKSVMLDDFAFQTSVDCKKVIKLCDDHIETLKNSCENENEWKKMRQDQLCLFLNIGPNTVCLDANYLKKVVKLLATRENSFEILVRELKSSPITFKQNGLSAILMPLIRDEYGSKIYNIKDYQ